MQPLDSWSDHYVCFMNFTTRNVWGTTQSLRLRYCMPKNVLQKSGCGWTSSRNRSPVVRYLKAATDFLQFVWLLTRGSTVFWMFIANLSCGKWGQDDCRTASWSYKKKKVQNINIDLCIPGMYRTTATDINRPALIC